jgi:hypothetical protein
MPQCCICAICAARDLELSPNLAYRPRAMASVEEPPWTADLDVGVEPHGWQSKTLGFSRSMYDQMPAKTLSLKLRVDCNIVDEICVCFWPSDHIAIDPSSGLNDYDAARDDFRGKVSQHWCRLASYARYIFDVSGTGDCANPCGVICRSSTNKRCQY